MNKSLALFRLAAAKTELDWNAVYSETLPRVYNYVLYRVGDRALAEDLTSATFERAWKQRQRYRPAQAAPLTWLLGIARHIVADHFRRPQRELPLEVTDALQVGPLVEDLVEQRAAAERLRALLQQLPSRERELIALKYGAALTNREIAAVTKLSESNVGTVLHRTVQKLRESWETDDR